MLPVSRGGAARPVARPRQDGRAAPNGFVVLAMGKHGAGELNYSSDIDLIVFFDLDASSLPSRRRAAGFFVRLTRDLVQLLQERTGDGYVFRTDLRLRPDPGATQLAISTEAALHLLRELRPELGARRADQGAARAPATSRPAASSSTTSRPSSGASISTSRPSPTSTP